MSKVMHLDDDVLTEILSRLRVKSLLKFKSVSKEWKVLIESPNFVSKHFNQDSNHDQLVLQYITSNYGLASFALFPEANLDSTPTIHEDLHVNIPVMKGDVYGPVNGLFFVYTYTIDYSDCLTLWNPATREWTPLPIPEPKIITYHRCCKAFGFGLDRVSNDIKIIWLRTNLEGELVLPLPKVVAYIYTLRTNTWRYKDDTLGGEFVIDQYYGNTCIKNVYYWAINFDFIDGFSIMSFDMGSEVFHSFLAPKGIRRAITTFTSYKDSLAIITQEHGTRRCEYFTDLWVMKDEGCWTKHWSLGPFSEDFGHHMLWRSNEILLQTERTGRLMLYDIESGESKDLGIQVLENAYCNTFFYKESLFSARLTT